MLQNIIHKLEAGFSPDEIPGFKLSGKSQKSSGLYAQHVHENWAINVTIETWLKDGETFYEVYINGGATLIASVKKPEKCPTCLK